MRRLVAICQNGGKFTTGGDGNLSYSGGDAHAMSITSNTKFDDFRDEVAEMWKLDPLCVTIKYFLPNNKRTLITISTDKDIERMIEFHEDSSTVDVYIMSATLAIGDATPLQFSGSSRTTAIEPASPFDASLVNLPGSEEVGQQSTTYNLGDIGQRKVLRSWKNSITGVGQQFNGKHEFRNALHKYSLAHGFHHVTKFSKRKHLRVMCKVEGCPWFILLSKLSNTPLFRIKKMNGTHNCCVGTEKAELPRPSNKLLASIIKEKLRDAPNTKPMDIVDGFSKEYGIEIDYHQAWSVMELARKELQGTYEEAYNQLPWICEKIIETNPGSAAILVKKEDLSFHRLFVSFHASLHGFHSGCRPLVFLNSIGLKSKYRGELLTAIALDGNDGVFPVAFAIVDELSDDNWHWFLVQLGGVLSTSQSITFIADRKREMNESLSQIFKNCYHGYCLCHLTEDLKEELKGAFSQEVILLIASEFYAAACALEIDRFKKCVENIKNISPEAYNWILQSDPEHWASAFFKGARYNHVKSSGVEGFYDWFSTLPALPIVQVIEAIRHKVMEWICIRRADLDNWSSKLTPTAEEKLQKNVANSYRLEVSSGSQGTYETRDSLGETNIVNLDCWDCSCKEWQIVGLPCMHAVGVIAHLGKDMHDYCSKYFTVETFRSTYLESINPLPSRERHQARESLPVRVHPPARRTTGRPKERVFLAKSSKSESLVKRSLRCSKCRGLGHNKSSCKQSS